MNGLSFSATTEKRKGILLDPRTKLILLLTITTLMFSTSNEGIMNIVKPCLSLVPLLWFCRNAVSKQQENIWCYMRFALYWNGLPLRVWADYSRSSCWQWHLSWRGLRPALWQVPIVISSTSISEFIGAMERMHITEKIVIPMSVIFRFFPTISKNISHPGCNENAGHTIRREKSFPDVGISPCSFDGVRCEDWWWTFCCCVDTGAWSPR